MSVDQLKTADVESHSTSGITDSILQINPNSFELELHYYPRVLNAQIHPMVASFFRLSTARIVNRYCHLHPEVNRNALESVLSYKPHSFNWAGCDLFPVTTGDGNRQMVLIETNSCPSGQKSMPLLIEGQEKGGYKLLIEETFKPLLEEKKLPKGDLAVIYDKNQMEASGYAATMSDLFNEPVYLVKYLEHDLDPPLKFKNGIMYIRLQQNKKESNWIPIRGAFRYVTQKPWNRIPIQTKTKILNPILVCLAGGRNKTVAAKAYEFYNAEMEESGLIIRTPETIWNLTKDEIPFWVQKLGGFAVIKNPNSNAGQGVFTITNNRELEEFIQKDHPYSKFIVQSLIGNSRWSSVSSAEQHYYHVGTVPNKHNQLFVADLRMMIHYNFSVKGFRPLAIYGRRARKPLVDDLDPEQSSWEILGTNLSIKQSDGSWSTQTNRLLLMDRRDFNLLGIGLDDLIEGFIQTVLATIAIDKMAINLLNKKQNKFKLELFRSMHPDNILISEIQQGLSL